VRKLAEEQQAPLGRLVVELGLLSEKICCRSCAIISTLPLMSLRDVPKPPLPIDLPASIGDFSRWHAWCRVKIEAAN